MPELPEVETVKRTLENLLIGLTIEDVTVHYKKIIRDSSVEDFCNKIIGEEIRNLNRIGKYLIFELEHYALISHLRMEGKYFYRQNCFESKHDHICFTLSNGNALVYNDTRKFGTMNIEHIDNYRSASYLKKLGIEPGNPNLTSNYLMTKVGSKGIAIKTALLDQSIISGLGNIYVDETLFLSGILPDRACKTLNANEYEKIVNSANKVIKKAISEGGTTIKSFSVSDGVHGRFQNHLNVHTKKKCGICGQDITKIKVNGRGTYFCIHCQK